MRKYFFRNALFCKSYEGYFISVILILKPLMAAPKCAFLTEYRQHCAVARNTGIEFSASFSFLFLFFSFILEVKTEAVSKASKPEHLIFNYSEGHWRRLLDLCRNCPGNNK